MHFDLLETISLAGDRDVPNDDRASADARRAWVIDGATDLGPPGLVGAQGGAAWLATAANRAFGLAEGTDLTEWCGGAFDTIERDWRTARQREPVAGWELPSASFLAVMLGDGDLACAWIGDCACLLRSANGTVRLGPQPSRAREIADAAAVIGSDHGGKPMRSPAVVADRRAARAKSVRRALSVDPAAARSSMRTVTVACLPGDEIVLMTDGFAALIDSYGQCDAATLFDRIRTEGLASLGGELRAIEDADRACERFPRFKCGDDATAIRLRIG